MKVSGFSFVKNAIKYDYPIVEAIKSILPICDEVIVAVGESDDKTLELIQGIDKEKIKIVETKWDESLREGGRVLAVETDKAFAAISEDSDWAFYIQGDEVIHEKYLDIIFENMKKYKDDKKTDGLLFNYLHFYGSYDYVGGSADWYPHEIRVIKNDKSIHSFQDAQGFRKGNNEKLRVRPIDAYMYHYGWAKEPKAMQKKEENFHRYWHDEKWIENNVVKADEYDYSRDVKELIPFTEGHPEVMKERIATRNWKFEYDISFNKKNLKDKFKDFLRNNMGIDLGYKNYIIEK